MINPLIVFGAMAYASVMWWVTRDKPISMDTRIFAVVLMGEAVMYLAFTFLDFPVEARVTAVRASLIVIALSQAIPLHISYRRSRQRG